MPWGDAFNVKLVSRLTQRNGIMFELNMVLNIVTRIFPCFSKFNVYKHIKYIISTSKVSSVLRSSKLSKISLLGVKSGGNPSLICFLVWLFHNNM